MDSCYIYADKQHSIILYSLSLAGIKDSQSQPHSQTPVLYGLLIMSITSITIETIPYISIIPEPYISASHSKVKFIEFQGFG